MSSIRSERIHPVQLSRIAAVALLFLAGGCGLLRRPSVVVDRSQDARIQREVEARISTDPALGASAIRVEVNGAIVTLYGSVHGIDGWNCAVRTAQLVEGVRSIVEYLVIERGPRIPSCRAAGGT